MADVAASFQAAVVEVIVTKTMEAVRLRGQKRLVLAGGVAANSRLRSDLAAACERAGVKLYVPDPILCTDNGAMIACAAYYKYREQGADDLTLDAFPDLAI